MKRDPYLDFIASKKLVLSDAGFDPRPIPNYLFPFQKVCVETAIRRGRSALFLNTGMGKTRCQLEWARQVSEHTGRPVFIAAPLAVSQQTVREGKRIGIDVRYCRDGSDVGDSLVCISNYERIGKFDHAAWAGVVLDESSILKAYSGAMKTAIFEAFAKTPYKLACTATPAPNDHLELGNHAEFLDVMSSHQMISRWFINDTSQFGTYRLKGHARMPFWDWVSSWAMMASLPSDLGDFDDSGYVLPELVDKTHVVNVDLARDEGSETLFRIVEMSATNLHKEKRRTSESRAKKLAELVSVEPSEQWLLWCETDYEADAITAEIKDAVDVRGSQTLEKKEEALTGFAEGNIRVMVTKPKLAGFGLNFQNCARVAFVGATYSFESYYQAIRRCWRFGQRRPVHVHMIASSTERAVLDTLAAKRDEFEQMREQMFLAARRAKEQRATDGAYKPTVDMKIPAWLKSKCERKTNAA
jgi:hypothetical protein